MRKLFGLLVMLFILYFSLQILFVYIGNGHSIDYVINDGDYSFLVHEDYRSNNKNDGDNYSLDIAMDDITFNILTYHDLKKSSKIISQIKYYEDNDYKCIFLKYRDNKILNDVLCNNGNYTTAYHNIDKPSASLTSFVNSLELYGYDDKKWIDDKDNINTSNGTILYSNNMIKNHFIGLINDKSIYRINSIDKVTLNYIDISNSIGIQAFTDNKYVIQDSDDITGRTYNIYSITSSKKYTIIANNDIDNAIVLGTYKDSVFLYDRDNEIEYEIDTGTKNILEVGNSKTSIKYYINGNLEHLKIEDVDFNNLNFGNKYVDDYNDPNFFKTVKVGYKYGYYYYFKKVNDFYQIYCSEIDSKNSLTYLFSTNSIDSVQFNDNFIYYIENGDLKYYSDVYGNRTLIHIDNLSDNTLYKVYIDKTKKA